MTKKKQIFFPMLGLGCGQGVILLMVPACYLYYFCVPGILLDIGMRLS